MNYVKEEISIETEFITLGQFIKYINIFESGGMIKGFLQTEGVLVNGEREHRRGRKLYPQDEIYIEEIDATYVVTIDKE